MKRPHLTHFPVLTLITTLLFFACGQDVRNAGSESAGATADRMWVASSQVDCPDGPGGRCLQVQRGDTITRGGWQVFAKAIDGFDYEPGFVYHLRVAAPASEGAPYTLVELINRTPDQLQRLHNIYALETIRGEEFTIPVGTQRPTLEVNVTDGRVLGSDGCNSFFGDLEATQGGTFKAGPLAGTKKACRDMSLASQYTGALAEARQYSLRPGKLILRDTNGQALLRFKAVD